jgi:hypothetical protein
LISSSYREKACKDAEDILGRSQQLLKQAGLQGLSILEEDVKLFCKESHNLRLIRGYPMFEELTSVPTEILQELGIASSKINSTKCKLHQNLIF